jgi:hypothetical protein
MIQLDLPYINWINVNYYTFKCQIHMLNFKFMTCLRTHDGICEDLFFKYWFI